TVLSELAKQHGDQVVTMQQLLNNPSLPREAVDAIVKHIKKSEMPESVKTKALKLAADHPSCAPLPPAKQAASKDTTPQQLIELATNHGNDKLVVIALLNNRN